MAFRKYLPCISQVSFCKQLFSSAKDAIGKFVNFNFGGHFKAKSTKSLSKTVNRVPNHEPYSAYLLQPTNHA